MIFESIRKSHCQSNTETILKVTLGKHLRDRVDAYNGLF